MYTSNYHYESVYEGNRPTEFDDDVEIIEGVNFKIEDMKFSQDEKLIALITKDTIKIYEIEENRILMDVVKFGEMSSIEFYDDTYYQLILGVDQQIFIYDFTYKQVLKKYPLISQPVQLRYANPFLIIGQKNNSILVLNLKTEQGYRYIKNIYNLNKETIFVANQSRFDCIVGYLNPDCQYIILDSLHMQYQSFISIKNLSIVSDEKAIELLKKKYNALQVSSFNSYLSHQQIFLAISKDSNLIAISPYVDNQKIYIYEYLNGSLKLLYQLYRGKSKKSLSLKFLEHDLLACFSFQNNIKHLKNDATLHLFYNYKSDQQDTQSLIRIYFHTQSDKETKCKRISQTLINYKEKKITVFSGNNFNFSEEIYLNGQPQSITFQDSSQKKAQNWF